MDIESGNTPPKLDQANQGDNPLARELHAEGVVRGIDQPGLKETRDLIIQKYNIAPNHVAVFEPTIKKNIRRVRAFSILSKNGESDQVYYAEGHAAHVELFDAICRRFIPEKSRDEIIDEISNSKIWTVRKGFLDPNQNGFALFPETRKAIIAELRRHKKINGYKEDDEITDETPIPNWILSEDSSSEESGD